MLSIFIKALLIGYSGAMMPGSLLTYTLGKSIKSGAKAGFIIALGHALMEFLFVILLFIGIGKYLSTNLAQLIIGLLGGVVLLLFGAQMLSDVLLKRLSIEVADETNDRLGKMLFSGAVISASNPYFYVWWSAVGLGLMMNSYTAFGLIGIVIFYVGHITADFSWYLFISALISKTRHFINIKIYHKIIFALGICLIGFGLSFIFSPLKAFVSSF